MEDRIDFLNSLSSAIKEYLSMRTDEFRKSIIAGLSASFSRVLAIVVISLLLVVVLAVFAFALIILIAESLGSISSAAFIVGGAYLAVTLILYFLIKRMFVGMFSNIFTEIMQKKTPNDNWKSFLILLIRNLRND